MMPISACWHWQVNNNNFPELQIQKPEGACEFSILLAILIVRYMSWLLQGLCV